MSLKYYFAAAIFVFAIASSLIIKVENVNPKHREREKSAPALTTEEKFKALYVEAVFQSYIMANDGAKIDDTAELMDGILKDTVPEKAIQMIVVHGYSIYKEYGDTYLSKEKELKEEIRDYLDYLLDQLKKEDTANKPIAI